MSGDHIMQGSLQPALRLHAGSFINVRVAETARGATSCTAVCPGPADEGAGNDWDFAFDDVETEALAKLKQLQLAPGLPPKDLPKIEKLVAMYKASECSNSELRRW